MKRRHNLFYLFQFGQRVGPLILIRPFVLIRGKPDFKCLRDTSQFMSGYLPGTGSSNLDHIVYSLIK